MGCDIEFVLFVSVIEFREILFMLFVSFIKFREDEVFELKRNLTM